ncbi:unnamed protein product, partial [Medioppia subpectinata]
TLRKYPTDSRLERRASDDTVLSAGRRPDIHVAKGVVIKIPTYAIHHSPDNYPDPFAFKPDRFLPQNRHHIKPYTYLPFGAGPRSCIGMRFALLEVKLGMVKMLQQFRFYRVPDTDVPLVLLRGYDRLYAKRLVVGVTKR